MLTFILSIICHSVAYVNTFLCLFTKNLKH
nr:MAG TPA: hypothetical protein [Caudoviricetes sp.]